MVRAKENFDLGNYQQVGHGEVTKPSCGSWKGYIGCVRKELHDVITIDGKRFTNKAYIKMVHNTCDRPPCPECFMTWAYKSSRRAEARLKEASRILGEKVEHIILSVPKTDYGLDYPKPLRKKIIEVLKSRGIFAGCIIFHAGRKKTRGKWYLSIHAHVLGFIEGGYDRCRFCENKVCVGYGNENKCDGFEARIRQLRKVDGYLLKVPADRDKTRPRNVGGTLYYQLSHASIKKGVSRFKVLSWFGDMGYRNAKLKVVREKCKCKICQHECVPLWYLGKKDFEKDRHHPDYKKEFIADIDEGEGDVWIEKPSKFNRGY